MGFFDQHQDNYDSVQNYDGSDEHKAKLSHELIGGAASYEAMKAYNDHVAKKGQPVDHAKAKELLAGFAGAFIDREVETRGLDFVDREKAKYQAQQNINNVGSGDLGY